MNEYFNKKTDKDAKGQFSLPDKQKLPATPPTTATPKSMFDRWEESLEIATEYAQWLCNISNEQEEHVARRTLYILELLSARWRESPEIALCYAKGLFNLCHRQGLSASLQTIYELSSLSDRWSESHEITMLYAKALVNLAAKQEEPAIYQTIDQLKALRKRRYKDALTAFETTLAYATALANLSCIQEDVAALQATVDELKALKDMWLGQFKLNLAYQKALRNLNEKQGNG